MSLTLHEEADISVCTEFAIWVVIGIRDQLTHTEYSTAKVPFIEVLHTLSICRYMQPDGYHGGSCLKFRLMAVSCGLNNST